MKPFFRAYGIPSNPRCLRIRPRAVPRLVFPKLLFPNPSLPKFEFPNLSFPKPVFPKLEFPKRCGGPFSISESPWLANRPVEELAAFASDEVALYDVDKKALDFC